MQKMRVDFYLISDDGPDARSILACRLLEKAYLRGHRVFVYCSTEEEAFHLDEMLWTFKEDSFIPHNLLGEGPEPPPPIQIGLKEAPKRFNDILLNFTHEIPDFHPQFKRIIEIVDHQEEHKQSSREHYRFYKQKGYQLYHHTIKTAVDD